MNQSNDENLTPMIIMRKKSSLVNLNDKREKISSSVEIRGKLSNYTFSVKDEKNFFDKISRNIKVIKNYKIPKVNDRSINKKISSPILISGNYILIKVRPLILTSKINSPIKIAF